MENVSAMRASRIGRSSTPVKPACIVSGNFLQTVQTHISVHQNPQALDDLDDILLSHTATFNGS